MDYQRINKLLDKYWECATSVEEERELRQFFSSAVVPPDLLPYKAWFVSHEAEALPPLGKEFDARILEHISEDRKLITTFGTLFKSITHLIHKIMGTNMKRAFTTLLCLLFCITISAQDKAADFSKLVGDWSFSAPDAPYGYQDGSFQIKQENGKLTAKVNIQGSTLEINDIKAKGDTYTSFFYVDGTPVDLTMTQKGNELEGMADAGGMQIPVKFKKTKK